MVCSERCGPRLGLRAGWRLVPDILSSIAIALEVHEVKTGTLKPEIEVLRLLEKGRGLLGVLLRADRMRRLLLVLLLRWPGECNLRLLGRCVLGAVVAQAEELDCSIYASYKRVPVRLEGCMVLPEIEVLLLEIVVVLLKFFVFAGYFCYEKA